LGDCSLGKGIPMAYTADFQIVVNSGIEGITLIEPLNVDALNYVTDEANLHCMDSGYAPISENDVPAFVRGAERAHLYAEAV